MNDTAQKNGQVLPHSIIPALIGAASLSWGTFTMFTTLQWFFGTGQGNFATVLLILLEIGLITAAAGLWIRKNWGRLLAVIAIALNIVFLIYQTIDLLLSNVLPPGFSALLSAIGFPVVTIVISLVAIAWLLTHRSHFSDATVPGGNQLYTGSLQQRQAQAKADIVRGVVLIVIGLAIAGAVLVLISTDPGMYILAWGPILFGGLYLSQGIPGVSASRK